MYQVNKYIIDELECAQNLMVEQKVDNKECVQIQEICSILLSHRKWVTVARAVGEGRDPEDTTG